MAMLADLVELVIGVDTHKHTHTAAVVAAATGVLVEQMTVPATRPATRCYRSWRGVTPVSACGRSKVPVAMMLA
jgi:hypothetical protein